MVGAGRNVNALRCAIVQQWYIAYYELDHWPVFSAKNLQEGE